MKLITLVTVLLLSILGVFAQAPEKMNYQAVARDLSGLPLVSTAVNLQFDVLQGSATGAVTYSETQSKTTNQFGLFTAEIGAGTVVSGSFSAIAWGVNAYFLRITVNGDVMPATQLLSVPYALYSKTSGGASALVAGPGIDITGGVITSILDTSSTNEFQTLTTNATLDTVFLSNNGGFVFIPPLAGDDWGTDTVNVLGNNILGSGTVANPLVVIDNDTSLTNELQNLTWNTTDSNIINLSNGTGINLSSNAPAANQVLTWNGANWIAQMVPSSSPWSKTGTVIHPTVLTENVGIGASTAAYPLEIRRSQAGTAPLFGITNPTVGDASIHFSTGTGNFSIGRNGNTFKIAHASNLGSNVRMTIGSTGNVGFGITAATAKVHAEGFGNQAFIAQNSSTTTATMDVINFGGGPAATFTNGNVGIGIATPTAKLHTSSTSNIALRLESSSTIGTWFEMRNSSAGGEVFSVISTGTTNGEGAGKLIFNRNAAFGTSSGTIMTLDHSTMNVGIGTTAPAARFHLNNTLRLENLGGAPPVAGTVLTAIDANGNAQWQAPIAAPASPWTITGASIHQTTLANNVGIGTTTPTDLLHVLTAGSGDVMLESTVGGNVAYRLKNVNTDYSWELSGVNLTLYHGATNVISTVSDNVGIGVAGPTAKLEIARTGLGLAEFFPSANTSYPLMLTPLGPGGKYMRIIHPSGPIMDFGSNGAVGRLGTSSNDNLSFIANSSVAMTILTGGNIGIGTINPSSKLHLHSTSGGGNFRMTGATTGTTTTDGFSMTNDGSSILFMEQHENAKWYFSTGGTVAMTIAPSANIGIGTTNPSSFAQFNVETTNYDETVRFNNTNTTGGGATGIWNRVVTNSVATINATYGIWSGVNNQSNSTVLSTATFANYSFTNNTGTGDSYGYYYTDFSPNGTSYGIYMDNEDQNYFSGNVGIGTTAPTANLSVNGTANKTGGGMWTVFSDARSKENVTNYKKGLNELLKLRPVSFNYKSEFNWGNKTYVGLIAQEVEKIVPTMVEQKEVNGIKDFREVDPNEINYMLINAIKEQQKMIDELKREINALKK